MRSNGAGRRILGRGTRRGTARGGSGMRGGTSRRGSRGTSAGSTSTSGRARGASGTTSGTRISPLGGTRRRMRRLGGTLLCGATRFRGCHGHAVGRGARLVLGNNRGAVSTVLPILSSFRHTLTSGDRSPGTVGRNMRVVFGGFVGALRNLNIGGVRATSGSFSMSFRRTVTVMPKVNSSGGNGMVSYMRANCALGSGIVHRTGMTMNRWGCERGVTGESCCRILNMSGRTSRSRVGGTCHGVTVGCRPSHGPNGGRTRRGFGRTTRTCRILRSPRGHRRCSRFKFGNPRKKFNKFNNNTNVSVGSVFSVFNSVFNNRNKFNNNFNKFNKDTRPRRCRKESLHMRTGLALRRTCTNYAGGFGVHGSMPYSSYRNAKYRDNSRPRAYPAYRKANCAIHAIHSVFNAVRARTTYPAYNNRNRVVGGGYGTYNNSKVMANRRIMRVGVPTNISSKVIMAIPKGKNTNGRGNMGNSLRIVMHMRGGRGFRHGSGSLCCGLMLSFSATILNNRMRVPALRKGAAVGVRPNARPNGRIHLHNGKVPTVRKCNCKGKSVVIGVAICVPGALGGRRGRLIGGFGRYRGFRTSGTAGGSLFSDVGGLFGGWLSPVVEEGQFLRGGVFLSGRGVANGLVVN